MALVEKELVSTTGNVWKDHVLVHTGETDRQTDIQTHTHRHTLSSYSQPTVLVSGQRKPFYPTFSSWFTCPPCR